MTKQAPDVNNVSQFLIESRRPGSHTFFRNSSVWTIPPAESSPRSPTKNDDDDDYDDDDNDDDAIQIR